ncbi:hypothetical protein [Bradyrhizobium sp. 21]|uniref:hypothetical protein n=1 Tax=Bradyrhizobium sp. 21 TaxID=2782666 RepID=UPI001FF8AB93|nr:hypothetical protein [Bradyrhizobium sp. 21]
MASWSFRVLKIRQETQCQIECCATVCIASIAENAPCTAFCLQQDGFALVVTAILGLVGPRVLNHLSGSKSKAAKIQIEGFA